MSVLRGVRGRLTAWYTLAVLVALLVWAVGVWLFLRHGLYESIDDRLHEDAERLARIASEPDASAALAAAIGERYGLRAEIRDADGDLIGGALFADEGLLVRRERREVDGRTFDVRVGRPLDEVEDELGELLVALGLGIPLAVIAAAAGGWFLARRALAPVIRMTDEAREITADRLSARLAIDTDDEVGRLATVFNDVLARLEDSFTRLERFTSDAAHELRTPLTAIRSVGEVALREAREPPALRDAVGSMLEETERLQRLVDDLLVLARKDDPARERTPVHLAAVGRSVADHLAVLAEDAGLAIRVEAPSDPIVLADEPSVRRAVINVAHNALRHGRTDVVIATTASNGEATLSVTDSGPGIAPEHLDALFDRFYRVDAARSRDRGGSGLGLAIARRCVATDGGRIEVTSTPGEGSIFRIVFPAHEEPGGDR